MAETGIVRIRNKSYKTVALRVSEFRATCPASDGWAIVTDLVERTTEYVIIRAQIIKEGVTLASGLAEEMRASSQINKTSALENCETSAIGRALAAFGLGGSEYASANEVQNAVQQQAKPKPTFTAQEQTYIDDALAEIAACDDFKFIKDMGLKIKEKSASVQEELRPKYETKYRILQRQEATASDAPL